MTIWTCPNCDRRFGAVGQGHDCRPGLTIDEYSSSALAGFRPMYDRIAERLESLDGDLIIDPIDKMVLFKHGGTFATLTSMTKWVAVGFGLRRQLTSRRLSRKVQTQGEKSWHVVNLHAPDDVDDELLDWLEEAFWASVGKTVPGDDDEGMVPDDVDIDIV